MLEQIGQWDGALLLCFQDIFVHDAWTPAVTFLTHLGDGGRLWILVTVVLLLFKRTRRLGLLTALAMLLTFLVNNLLLKELVDRARPYETWDAVQRLIAKPSDASFPSGHAANSFAAAFSIYLGSSKKVGVPVLLLALLIALSRLYVGVHYPLDILCGALIGSLMAWLVYRIDLYRREAAEPARHGR